MRKTDRITGILTILGGAWVAYLSSNMRLQNGGVPGPGLLPLICGFMLIAFGLALVARPAAAGIPVAWPPRVEGARVLGTLIAMAVYTFLVPFLGFTLSTGIFLAVLIWWWGSYQIWKAAVIAAVVAFAMVLIFQVLLGAPLPVGFWG